MINIKIKRYHEILEKHIENPEFRINSFFTELQKNINDWFENGSLSASGAELIETDISRSNGIEKNLILDFNDGDFGYQVIFILSIEDVSEDDISDCFIKVKKYNNVGDLIRTSSNNVKTKDINEDIILEMIASMDEKSNSLSDSDNSLSDDESNLGNTAMY